VTCCSQKFCRISRLEIEEGGLIWVAGRGAAEAANCRSGWSTSKALDEGHRLEARKTRLHRSLVAIGQKLCPERWRALGDLAGNMDGRLDIAERVMGIVRCETIQRRNTVQLEAHAPSFIDGPLEQIRLTIPDRIERCQDIEPGIAIELSGKNIGLQVLIECLAQHLLIEMDAVEPGPGGGRPARNQSADILGELEKRRQVRIHQLRGAHARDSESPRRWDDMRRDAAAQIDPLDLPEFAIRENGRELQGLIEGGRDAMRHYNLGQRDRQQP